MPSVHQSAVFFIQSGIPADGLVGSNNGTEIKFWFARYSVDKINSSSAICLSVHMITNSVYQFGKSPDSWAYAKDGIIRANANTRYVRCKHGVERVLVYEYSWNSW